MCHRQRRAAHSKPSEAKRTIGQVDQIQDAIAIDVCGYRRPLTLVPAGVGVTLLADRGCPKPSSRCA